MAEGPTRLTVRGGRDQFNWSSVKDDKHYQNYLGHSLKAPVGRWQKDKDLEWFSRDKFTTGDDGAIDELARERMRVREVEEEAVAEAMGITLPSREERRAQIEAAELVRKEQSHLLEGKEETRRTSDERERRHRRRDYHDSHKSHGSHRHHDARSSTSQERRQRRRQQRHSHRDESEEEEEEEEQRRRERRRRDSRRRSRSRDRRRDRSRDRSRSRSRDRPRRQS